MLSDVTKETFSWMNKEIVMWVFCALATSSSESSETKHQETTGGTKGQKELQIPYTCVPKAQEFFLGCTVFNYTFPATEQPTLDLIRWAVWNARPNPWRTPRFWRWMGHGQSLWDSTQPPPSQGLSLGVSYSYVWEVQANSGEHWIFLRSLE